MMVANGIIMFLEPDKQYRFVLDKNLRPPCVLIQSLYDCDKEP